MDLQELIQWFIQFINGTLVPLVFALAFILFLFGVFRYFFSAGSNADEKRKEGQKFIMWGIIAFAVMIAVWGLVNILVNTIPGLDKSRPCLPTFGGECQESPRSSGNNMPENLLPSGFSGNEPTYPDSGTPGVY